MNNLPEFKFNGHEFNYQMVEGNPVFLALDACEIMGTKTKDIPAILDDDEYMTCARHYRGQVRDLTFLTEAGLYSLILRSRKPEAKEFKRWITHEVLPALRKTGGYVVALPDDTAEAIGQRAIQAGLDAIERLQKMVAERDQQIAVIAPKAGVFDAHCGRTMRLAQFCRSLDGINANKIKRSLLNNGYFYNQGLGYRVYSQYRDVLFVEKNLPQHGAMEIFITAEGKKVVTQLYNDGALIMKVVKKSKKKAA